MWILTRPAPPNSTDLTRFAKMSKDFNGPHFDSDDDIIAAGPVSGDSRRRPLQRNNLHAPRPPDQVCQV